jgi:hypothetical protein
MLIAAEDNVAALAMSTVARLAFVENAVRILFIKHPFKNNLSLK